MQENLQVSLMRSSKKVKKNYKKLTLLTFHQDESPMKFKKVQQKNYNVQTYKPNKIINSSKDNQDQILASLLNSNKKFLNIEFYPQPIQGMLRLKKKLSMLDINTITQVLSSPDKNCLEKMEFVARDQEKMVQEIGLPKFYDEQQIMQSNFNENQIVNIENPFLMIPNSPFKQEFLLDDYSNQNINENLRLCDRDLFRLSGKIKDIFK